MPQDGEQPGGGHRGQPLLQHRQDALLCVQGGGGLPQQELVGTVPSKVRAAGGHLEEGRAILSFLIFNRTWIVQEAVLKMISQIPDTLDVISK